MKRMNEKGSAAIILCLVITALFAFTAYVVDIGLVYIEKTKLSDAIDSAVLAASMELPGSPSNARQVAIEYLNRNNVDEKDVSIVIAPDGKSIEIDGKKNVQHIFAPIIGINSSEVHASTEAVLGPIKSVSKGIRPFAVENNNFVYGDEITLKSGAGSGYCGNYGAVALGGTGSSVYLANALYGYDGTISVGDYIDTEPGNMAGATNRIMNYINSEQSTFDNFPKDSIRVWTLPIVDTLEVNGRSSVRVIGFGEFYVESVYNSGGMEITGRFLQYVVNGPIDSSLPDEGAYGIKLIK